MIEYYNSDLKNKYCKSKNLRNESDVEQNFIVPFLNDLGFTEDLRKSKTTISLIEIGKGKKKKKYVPDFVCYLDKLHYKPILIIDAKSPNEGADEGISDSQLYTAIIRRNITAPKPKQYCIGTNGLVFIVKEYESDKEKIRLNFEDFQEDNKKYKELKSLLSYLKLNEEYEQLKEKPLTEEAFEFYRPEIGEIEGIFRACHNLIWKKEKKKPTEAFYEFSKLFFVKLFYDRKIHDEFLKQNLKPAINDFKFSINFIESQERAEFKNPINNLFQNIRDNLEREIREKNRKRIFEKNEEIDLKPSTTRAVIELLEHLDLFGIDEELNGRMFETFLSATIRGKELGQFFTPRKVVKFMVQLADIKVSDEHIDKILDGLCGSGGFLVEEMSVMFDKINKKQNLSDIQKKELKNKVVKECLWGTDADIKISRIARMNMYLNGDGSNRIYWLPDFFDKDFLIEEEDSELQEEVKEFKKKINNENLRFDIVLTNPPFSMRYQAEKLDERRILEQYEVVKKPDGSLRDSLKSNVLSLERYRDLLKTHGKLITIIDESVLNTDTEKDFRNFIKKEFIIKAVISLPRNTFVNADTNVKTSILYLIKKEREDESQPDIFMALSENVGHTDAGKPSEKSDLMLMEDNKGEIINKEIKKTILEEFKAFENGN